MAEGVTTELPTTDHAGYHAWVHRLATRRVGDDRLETVKTEARETQKLQGSPQKREREEAVACGINRPADQCVDPAARDHRDI